MGDHMIRVLMGRAVADYGRVYKDQGRTTTINPLWSWSIWKRRKDEKRENRSSSEVPVSGLRDSKDSEKKKKGESPPKDTTP